MNDVLCIDDSASAGVREIDPSLARSRLVRDPEVIRRTLLGARALDAPVSLLCAGMATSWTARLVLIGRDRVVLSLVRMPTVGLVLDGACAITFPLEGRTAGFVSRVVALQRLDDGQVHITVAVPETLHRIELRHAVRVPVPAGALQCVLEVHDECYTVHPVDLGMRGILVELDEDPAPPLRVGGRHAVELTMSDVTLELPCELRRIEGRRHGFMFLLDRVPPIALASMIFELQRRSSRIPVFARPKAGPRST